jgi:hypothetical protein
LTASTPDWRSSIVARAERPPTLADAEHLRRSADLCSAGRQLGQRDVHGPLDVAGLPLVVLAHVEDDQLLGHGNRHLVGGHGGNCCGEIMSPVSQDRSARSAGRSD